MQKLPPAVLAALGLTACVDGCSIDDLPVVGDLFGDDDDAAQPCLNIMQVGPCLEAPPVVHPCLSPVPEPAVAPCLSEIPEMGPCLKIVVDPIDSPVPSPRPDLAPCLRMPPPERVGPCLDMAAPPARPPAPCLTPVRPDPAPGEPHGAIPRADALLRRLADAGVLPADLLERLTGGTEGPRRG